MPGGVESGLSYTESIKDNDQELAHLETKFTAPPIRK